MSEDTYKAQLDIINKIAEHINAIVKPILKRMVAARKKLIILKTFAKKPLIMTKR